jgi:hypothetical protein
MTLHLDQVLSVVAIVASVLGMGWQIERRAVEREERRKRETAEMIDRQVSTLKSLLIPNGGSSIPDRIERLESAVVDLRVLVLSREAQ